MTTALMAKLPKLVYHIMKDKALKKLMSDAGLMTTGRREQMIARHKEFTLRVNAAIDSGHQPNLAAIAREVGKLERDRDRAANGGSVRAVGWPRRRWREAVWPELRAPRRTSSGSSSPTSERARERRGEG